MCWLLQVECLVLCRYSRMFGEVLDTGGAKVMGQHEAGLCYHLIEAAPALRAGSGSGRPRLDFQLFS